MKITGPGLSGTTRVGGPAARGPGRGEGFAVKGGGAAREPAAAGRASAPSNVGSVDALLALQELDGPLERRRRAVKRGARILDQLDEVKLGVLSGEVAPETLARLTDAVREQRGPTGDPGLEGVLDQIETRAAVELAKREMRDPVTGT